MGKALKHVQDVNCMKKRELLLIRLNVFATTELLRKLDQKSLLEQYFMPKIEKMVDLPDSEIEKIFLSKELPECWTYPEIQPYMIDEYKRRRGS